MLEKILELFKGVSVKQATIYGDAGKVVYSMSRIFLWNKELAHPGSVFPGTERDPVERIEHHTEIVERYTGYLAKYISEGTALEDIIAYVKKALSYIPEEIKGIIVKFIEDLINKKLKELI